MQFFDDLPADTKRAVLVSSQNQLATELTTILLRFGIDPATFDVNDTSTLPSLGISGDTSRIEQICQGLALIETKLGLLG